VSLSSYMDIMIFRHHIFPKIQSVPKALKHWYLIAADARLGRGISSVGRQMVCKG